MARDREMNELSRFLQSVIVGIETGIVSRPVDPDPVCTVDSTAVLGGWANRESAGQFGSPERVPKGVIRMIGYAGIIEERLD